YVQAIDIKRGLIPHKETVIFYGYLTSWIQGLSLNLFGDSLKSIGIATGAFYSVTFFLSYKIFLKFLSKPLSCLSVLLIFFLHVRIVFPWPNYFVYTFQLLSILSFISDRKINRFFSGLCLGLAWLCRYSSIVAILPPFLIFIGYELLIQ